MDYKLIKLKERYIIVSDEITGFENNIWVHNNGRIWVWKNTMALRSNNKPKKIIASNFIPELPNIDFNDLEEDFGIIDIKKLASIYANKELNEEFTSKSSNFYGFYSSFLDGFNKCLELNKDKLYTENNINTLREILMKGALSNMSCSSAIVEFDKFIKSLQPKTEWDIEVELTEEKCNLYGCINPMLYPKTVNNKIKITKIL